MGPDSLEPARNRQELRLALSMRGGVSLAVWIGGAVAEIARLRQAVLEKDSTSPLARLAELSGYHSVRIDVLTGASAGGLNATILAASLVYGFRFDAIRDLWIQLGDLEAMCRATPTLFHRRPESVLDGDNYFGAELHRRLTELIAQTPRCPQADAVDLMLTATLLDPITVTRRDDAGQPMLEHRRSAAFRFRHRGNPGDPLSDFAAGEQAVHTAAQLAIAARATASFPLAFEPASVWSQSVTPKGKTNLYGLFSETAAPDADRPFQVIDGGVLDNIPVTAAIRTIASAPADGPTDRWLLYLNPEPILGSSVNLTRNRLRGLPVGLTALAARYGQESLLTDIDELEAHNAEVERAQQRRNIIFAPLISAAPQDRADILAKLADIKNFSPDIPQLFSALELCIRWARYVERWISASQLQLVGDLKAEFYRLRQVIEVVIGNRPEPDEGERLWVDIVSVAMRLAQVAPPAPEHRDNADLCIIHQLLREAEDLSIVLKQLVVLTAPLQIEWVSDDPIQFLRIATNATTALPFTRLLAGKAELSPDDKLCGLDLGAFAAFCSAKWRANDWMWGRMDAAANLVTLLTNPARLRQFSPTRNADAVYEAIAAIVTSPPQHIDLGKKADLLEEQWQTFFTDRWKTQERAVRAELGELFNAQVGDYPNLAHTRAALTERLQWEIVSTEMSFINEVNLGAHPEQAPNPEPAAPQDLVNTVSDYEVGRHSILDLGDIRVSRIAARLGLLLYRTVKPIGWTVPQLAVRSGMSLLKPVLLLLTVILSAPERALLVAAVLIGGALVSQSGQGLPVVDLSWPWDWLAKGLLINLTDYALAIASIVITILGLRSVCFNYRRGTPSGGVPRPVWLSVLALAVIVASWLVAITGFTTTTLVTIIISTLAVWLANYWVRPAIRFVLTGLGLTVFAGTAGVFTYYQVPGLWWLIVAAVLSNYAICALVTVVDPLPRRRPLV